MDTDPLVSLARARAARLAVSTLFFVNGLVVASLLPRLPAIKDGLGLTNTELGTAVAALPVGGLLAGGLAGLLIARFGSGRVAAVAGTGTALVLIALGLAGSWTTLALAYLLLGMFDATMDAAMNAHGVGVQRRYGRSILQGFHGLWSVGGMVAGALGALAAAAGVPVPVHLAVVAVAGAAGVVAAARHLLPAAIADTPPAGAAEPAPLRPRDLPRLLRVLLPLAMLGILTALLQSSAATWSAIYLTDVLGQAAGVAASAFVLYMAAMVLGRLTNDRWVDRRGPVWVVRAGALVGVTGLVAVIGAGPPALVLVALLGFAAVGYGSSPMFPVMVGAAGSRPGIPAGHGIAISTWLVRAGMIVAPSLVGIAADAFGLTAALAIPLVAGLVIAVITPVLTGHPLRRPRRAPEASVLR